MGRALRRRVDAAVGAEVRRAGDRAPSRRRGLSEAALYAAVLSDGAGHDGWLARLAPDGALMWGGHGKHRLGDDYATQAAVIGEDLVITGLASEGALAALWTRRFAADGTAMWTSTHPLGVKTNFYPLGPGLTVGLQQDIVGGTMISEQTDQDAWLAIFSP